MYACVVLHPPALTRPSSYIWIKEGSIIGGHVENLVLATYTPFPTSNYTNSMKKTALFPQSSYLLAAVETHDGVFNHTTTRNKKATIHWCQSQQSSGAQSRKRGWWKARSMTQHTMKAAATVLWCSGSSCRQLSPFSEWLL